jgi:pyruvate formate lyase activating enzyme
MALKKMQIGGLQKVTLIDYPGKISAVVFTRGCNFRCPYCHNPELVEPERYSSCLHQKDVFDFFKSRRGKLDAITVTGGEPTLQEDLTDVIRRIRRMGFFVKLDSNGSKPEVLENLIRDHLVDYIALDVKAPAAKYQDVVRAPVSCSGISDSIRLVLTSGIEHEFRTTVVKSLLSPEDILWIAREIAGARRYVLQKFQRAKTLDKQYGEENTYPDNELLTIKKRLEKEIPSIIIR